MIVTGRADICVILNSSIDEINTVVIDLKNVKRLEKFKQTKVVDSMNGLKQEIEKREIWLKKFYS